MNSSFDIVQDFERRVAALAGSRFAVAVATGTWAIFLACRYLKVQEVTLPARTFISVPMAVIHAGGSVRFVDEPWLGVYRLEPYPIVDSALRFRRGMYEGGLHCLSFHARKILNIGEGGMILTDDAAAADWLMAARYSGRKGPMFHVKQVTMLGWQAYMNPEKAARGMHLMEYVGDGEPDQVIEYPDLREAPVFAASPQTGFSSGGGPNSRLHPLELD